VDIVFASEELDRLEVDRAFTAGLSSGLVKAYRSRINIIRQATDERTFYEFKSLHFEKLEGKRKGQYSMRLNDQYRLIMELVEQKPKNKKVKLIEIIDYH
jgi:proteic killer suppression protein